MVANSSPDSTCIHDIVPRRAWASRPSFFSKATNSVRSLDFAKVIIDHIVPAYGALMESYAKAQDVQKVGG